VRAFARPFPIDRLSLEARVLYTGFLVFMLLGLVSSVWLYADSFGGLGGRDAASYFHGAQSAPPTPEDARGGPQLELPSDPTAAEDGGGGLRMAKPARQVLETFHFHLFTVPVVLLIVGHLFMLTSLATRTKVVVLLVASVSTLLHVLAPLLIRFVDPGLGGLMPITVVAAGIGWMPLLVWPLWEMWKPVPEVAA
jgi:hypothetical protein